MAVREELSRDGGVTVDAMFVAIVDIVAMRSHVIVVGERERSLAKEAGFDAEPLSAEARALVGEKSSKYVYVMKPGAVSRKADFVPPLTEAVDNGWCPSVNAGSKGRSVSETNLAALAEQTELTVDYSQGPSKIIRRQTGLSLSGMSRMLSYVSEGSDELSASPPPQLR